METFTAKSEVIRPTIFHDSQPGPTEEDLAPSLIDMARAIAKICATRMLLMVAVVGAVALWGWTIVDPEKFRIIAAGVYSVVVVWPLTALYFSKG